MTSTAELNMLAAFQVTAHIGTCLALLMYIIALGLRPDKQASEPTVTAFWACVVYCSFQIVLWAVMFSVNTQEIVSLQSSGFEFVWNFLWAPQMSVAALWFFLSHVVQSCPQIKVSIPRSAIAPGYRSVVLSRSLAAGVIGTIIADSIVPLESLDPLHIVTALISFAVVSTAFELVLKRYKCRQMSLASPTVAWLYGVWIGAWVIAAL